MNKKLQIIIAFVILFIIVALGSLAIPSVVVWPISLVWHFSHKSNVVFRNVGIKLPLRWYVDKKDGNMISLVAVPPGKLKEYGVVTIRSIFMNEEQIALECKRTFISEDSVQFVRYDRRTIDNKNAIGILFVVVNKKHTSTETWYYGIWTIPEEKVVIRAVKIPVEYSNYFFQLLSNISFIVIGKKSNPLL